MKAMFEVIKYEGDNDNLVWRHPAEDFSTKSQLVVQQAQEAIFYYKGQMADRFTEPGTYTLDTQNIPILRHLVNLPFGKVSPFHAVVYFVNKTEKTNIRWGAGPIPYIDPNYALPLQTGISGEYNFKVIHPETLMEKMVGSLGEYNTQQFKNNLDSYLKAKVTAHMTAFYQSNEVDLFTIESQIGTIAYILEPKIREDFQEYGIEITKFAVTGIAKHEDSPEYKRYYEFRTQQQALKDIELMGSRELAATEMANRVAIKQKEGDVAIQHMQQDTDARGVVVDSQAQALKRQQEGYTYQQERGFDVAEKTAQNEGAGNFASAGMGIGMGIGAMGAAAQTVGGLYNDALSNVNLGVTPNETKQEQPQENNPFAGVSLGLDAEEQSVSPVQTQSNAKVSRRERLQEIKELFEDGLISQEEFEAKKKAIIEEV